jgi:hypothetical protein
VIGLYNGHNVVCGESGEAEKTVNDGNIEINEILQSVLRKTWKGIQRPHILNASLKNYSRI